MKNLLLICALSIGTWLSAQIDFRNTRFGIIAGPNVSQILYAHNSSGPRYSFFGGVLGLISIDNNDSFYFQPEVLYVSSGENGDRKYENRKGLPHATYASNYVSIPINFKAYYSSDESEFFAFVGPRFDFLISQKITNSSREAYEISTYGKAGSFNLNLGFGVGYSYKRQLELFAKYDFGISNVLPVLKNSPGELSTQDPNVLKKKSQQVFSVGLSYILE